LHSQRLTLLEDQNQVLYLENKRLADTQAMTKEHMRELEGLIGQMRDEIDQKTMMLEEYEQNMDASRQSERFTQHSSNLISAQDLADLKSKLSD
jgi:hypothetical protein